MKQLQVVVSAMILLLSSMFAPAQQVVATNTNVVVPPLVNFSGTLVDGNGRPLTGTVAVTFSLYSEQSGGAALWMESQNVQTDHSGHYTVMLGSTSSTGLPAEIFVAGQAHWLGVQVQGEQEQPRVLLVSAPYALKGWRRADIRRSSSTAQGRLFLPQRPRGESHTSGTAAG